MRKSKLTGTEQGFTLIEMLLVMVIMGIMLAVIVPRAWRANVDAKYTLVRQNCTELVAFANNWAEQSLQAQKDTDSCSIYDYFITLAGSKTAGKHGCWIADTDGNWTGKVKLKPNGRTDKPEVVVSAVIDPSKMPRNPFNGASVFVNANDPSKKKGVIPGAVCCVSYPEGGTANFTTFALLFQGTDSTTYNPTGIGGPNLLTTSFYAGQSGESLAGVRNGVFLARLN